jgi:hypothetical protein
MLQGVSCLVTCMSLSVRLCVDTFHSSRDLNAFQSELLPSSFVKYLYRKFRFSPCERRFVPNLHEPNVKIC